MELQCRGSSCGASEAMGTHRDAPSVNNNENIRRAGGCTSWSVLSLLESVRRVFGSRKTWYVIGAGQLLSLFICGTGVTSQLLQTYNFAAPLSQLFLTYFCLGLVFATSLAYRKGGKLLREALRKRGWKYLILSAIDVGANFAVVKAYQYTTLTSVQLLDGFSIPSVMLLSRFVLKARFKCGHYLGVIVCVSGMVTLIVTDYFHNYRDAGQESKSKHSQIIGDALCLLGAFLYATSNVCEEYLVKRVAVTEFLGMLGFMASGICGVLILIFERSELGNVDWDHHVTAVVLLALGFTACQVFVYLMMPFVMRLSSAVTINLSLLTADLYSLLFGLILFSYKFSGLYFLAFVLILAGLILYTSIPVTSPHIHHAQSPDDLSDPDLAQQPQNGCHMSSESDQTGLSSSPKVDRATEQSSADTPTCVVLDAAPDSEADPLSDDVSPLILQPP